MGGTVFRDQRVTAAVAVALLMSVGACSNGDAQQRAAPASSGSPTMGAEAPASSAPPSGMDMGGDHTPIPPNTQVLDTGQIYSQDRKGVVCIYGRTPFGLAGGSGFIHDLEAGMAITNAHVVDGLTGVKARFFDGTVLPIHVMGVDPCSDLAVVHFGGELPEGTIRLPLGDSNALRPGDQVTALGYPVSANASFRHPRLVPTTGTVQAPHVRYDNVADLNAVTAIEHGATIQHGNSGGPLTDNKGNVVGINTRLGPEDTQGQYYAIPIADAHELSEKLMTGESVNDLGWQLYAHRLHSYTEFYGKAGDAIEQYLKKAHQAGGMIVGAVRAGGPVDRKLQTGDLVTSMSNTSVASMTQVCDIIESTLPGRDVISIDGIHLDPAQKNFGDAFHVQFVMPGKH
jgi:S1-C subfamily serine protease